MVPLVQGKQLSQKCCPSGKLPKELPAFSQDVVLWSIRSGGHIFCATMGAIYKITFPSLMFPAWFFFLLLFPEVALTLSFIWWQIFFTPSSQPRQIERNRLCNCAVNFRSRPPPPHSITLEIYQWSMISCGRIVNKPSVSPRVWPFVLWIWRGVNKASSLWMMRSLAEIIGLCCNDLKTGITHHILKSWSAQP